MSDDPSGSSKAHASGQTLVDGLPFSVGSTIAGKYRVDRVLGAGGMGVILAGHHVALDQRVAIKVLKPSAIDNAELVTRFGREARAAARLRSEHVARVLDVGQSENGLPFMVMEYLSGKDLSKVVRERGPLPIEEACEYVLQACEGLAEAHNAGIVHRDLKPANLFLTKGTDGAPLVKVLDFGISKLIPKAGDDAAPSEGLTQTQSMIGSPHYMSPEQLKSARDVDARTDIWSLGGVLFKLLTNEPAFEGASTPELCVSILVGPARSMRSLRPDIPEELEEVVRRCLAKEPSGRYSSVSELARALSRFAPAQSRSSVERIARVATNPRLRFGGSDPPGAPPSAAPTRDAAAPSAGPEPDTAHVEMTTLTSSAASLPADTKPARGERGAASTRSRAPIAIAIAAAALAAVAGAAGIAFTMKSGDAHPRPQGMVAPPPESTAPTAPATATVAATAAATAAGTATAAAAAPTAPAIEARPAAAAGVAIARPAPSAPTTTTASSAGAARSPKTSTTAARPATTAKSPATGAPTSTTPPAQPPPASTTPSGMPDFGGRK